MTTPGKAFLSILDILLPPPWIAFLSASARTVALIYSAPAAVFLESLCSKNTVAGRDKVCCRRHVVRGSCKSVGNCGPRCARWARESSERSREFLPGPCPRARLKGSGEHLHPTAPCVACVPQWFPVGFRRSPPARAGAVRVRGEAAGAPPQHRG